MEHHNILEILRDAMELEREGARYYTKAAKHTKLDSSRKVFKKLAVDEMSHLDKLEQVFDEFCENNEWMVEADVALPVSKELDTSDVFEEDKIAGEFDETQAVELAISAEKNSINLYRTALKECKPEHAAGCKLFKWLVEFEKTHVEELKKLKAEISKRR